MNPDIQFGLILMIVGMAGTLASLGLLAVMAVLIKRAFPIESEKPD